MQQSRRFLHDRPAFRPVVAQLSPNQGLAEMVDHVIEFCQVRMLFADLLATIEEHNPRQFAVHEPYSYDAATATTPGTHDRPAPQERLAANRSEAKVRKILVVVVTAITLVVLVLCVLFVSYVVQMARWGSRVDDALDRGQYREALNLSQQALAITRRYGERAPEGEILNVIGFVYYRQGLYDQALETLRLRWSSLGILAPVH